MRLSIYLEELSAHNYRESKKDAGKSAADAGYEITEEITDEDDGSDWWNEED